MTTERHVFSEDCYLSEDGSVFFSKEELEQLALRFPDLECVPALIAKCCKTWLMQPNIAPGDRKQVLLAWFEKRARRGGFRERRRHQKQIVRSTAQHGASPRIAHGTRARAARKIEAIPSKDPATK